MMDSDHLDQAEKSSPETFSDSSLSSDSPDTNDIFGDPLVHPRVGDEYQVEIPSILSESELLHLMKNTADTEGIVNSSHLFLTVTWVCNQANPIKTKRLEYHDGLHAKYTNGLVGPKNLETVQISSDIKEPNVQVDYPTQTSVNNGKWLVPDQPTESWSDFEADCFLLGLYLLGKNLLQVKMFVESKGLGQLLAYYYGQFYASTEYSRWSECRKMRSRKCVIGHKFFTGYRQQELFSRLFPRISEETKAKLFEASRAFAEGRSSLDEYVFTLKALVGILALVDAVGIGKGKQDLTTLIFDGPKNNQIFSHRPEVPSGKAWSSLTCGEIVKYLTGDFRLSKARSNDLFWEAVWPRLLARGWHSEQPRGEGFKGSKHLVFLMPGIKKFSRRKLSKGDHYFDSVTDVLAKVASEPKLLELEADENTPSCSKGENGWATEVKTDDEQDSSDHERHCYLKPHVSSGLSDLTKFTVVDTSLVDEDNPYKVRELRSLPAEAKRSLAFTSPMRKTETKLQVNGDVLRNGHQSSIFSANGSLNLPSNPADASLPVDHKSRTIKHQFSRRVKSGSSSCVGPVTKRRRLASCVDADVTCVLSLPAKNKNATLRIVGPKLSQTDVKLTSDKVVVAVIHTEKSLQDSLSGNHVDFNMTPENEKMTIAQHAIDLNLPQSPTEPESHGKVKLEDEVSTSNQTANVEKMKHFDNEKQKHCDGEKKRYSDSEILTSSDVEKPKQFVTEKHKSSADIFSFPDKMEPHVSFASGEPFNEAIQFDEQPIRHFIAGKHKVSEDIVGPSDIMEPPMSSGSAESPNKAVKLDQQPRRQSTRNRPLTTKALEALEIGLLSPVRTYRKRFPSVAQDQKPKRARQSRKKSPMFSHDTVFEETYNEQTIMVGQPPMGSIPNDKENMAGEAPFPPAST